MQSNPSVANLLNMPVAAADEQTRASFIRKTYQHTVGAILAFAALLSVFYQLGWGEGFLEMLGQSQYSWLIVLGAFMLVSHVANKWAVSATDIRTQYAGLGLYVVANAIIFLPLITIAVDYMPEGQGTTVLQEAVIATLFMTAGLTAVAFITRADFSFLGRFLVIGGFIALGVIVCSIIFGFTLGTLFSGIMVVFASASILHTSSNIIHHYRVGQHVAASLALFAGIALLFWYILRIIMSRR